MKQPIERTCSPNLFPQPYEILAYKQVAVEECIELPDYKPIIHRIIDIKINPELESHRIMDSPQGKKVFIKGHLDQEILYAVDSLCQPVHAFHSISPFCTFISLGNCYIYNCNWLEAYKPKILVEHIEFAQVSCRSMRKCLLLYIWYPKAILRATRKGPII